LEAITGLAITKAGLGSIYAAALPDTRVKLSAFTSKEGVFEYSIAWIGNLAEPVATVRRKLVRPDDGAIELYAHGAWVDEEHRGRGLSAKVMEAELALLALLSTHPGTRLSLWAGSTSNPKKRSEQQTLGPYVWAEHGFDFASRHGVKTTLGLNTARARCPGDEGELAALGDDALVKHQLRKFVDARVADGTLALDAGAKAALFDAIERAKTPADLSRLDTGHVLDAKVGESTVRCPLGKAFFLSGEAPRWEGVLFVNDRAAPSAVIARAAAAQAEQKAKAWTERLDVGLARDLASDDETVKKAAIERAGTLGGARWIERLQKIAERTPELSDDVERAILRIEGKWRPPVPRYEYTAWVPGAPRKVEVPPELKELTTLDEAGLAERVRGAAPRVAATALELLAEKRAETAPDEVRDAAKALAARIPGDDTWFQRKTAIDVLGRLPKRAGLEAIAELSASEDDINVMIAMSRWLESSDDAALAAPSSALAERIEVMKEEIRIALAELG
ncbi:hypothetical protein L6R52_24440, partial [Myxococcota bacterium]|nr:hypothetical protein [Myxococcota bacterium]